MNYDKTVNYIKENYGFAICDYFVNKNCKSKGSKISRTKEKLR